MQPSLITLGYIFSATEGKMRSLWSGWKGSHLIMGWIITNGKEEPGRRQADNFSFLSPFSVVLPWALLENSSAPSKFPHGRTFCVTPWLTEKTWPVQEPISSNALHCFLLPFLHHCELAPSKWNIRTSIRASPLLSRRLSTFPWPTCWLCHRVHGKPWKWRSHVFLEPGNVV